MNLASIESFPNLFTETRNFEMLLRNLRSYRIPETIYYSSGAEQNRLRPQIVSSVFGVNDASPKFNTYRNVISYDRSNNDPTKNSNSPIPPNNLQINITTNVNAAGNIQSYNIQNIPQPISGEWLQFDTKRNKSQYFDTKSGTYFDAFIAYNSAIYSYQWLNGMPPSIKQLIGTHLLILKQRIVEETIQYIINNKNKPNTEASKEQYLVDLYESIRVLGN